MLAGRAWVLVCLLLLLCLPAAALSAARSSPARVQVVTVGFSLPTGVAVGRGGNVFVADGGWRLRKLSPQGKVLAQWGAQGSGNGQLDDPNLLTVDLHGNLYIPDSQNNRVVKLSAHGHLLATWGTAGTDPGQLQRPLGAAVDARGNIYVTDSFNNRVQELSPGGKPLAIWGPDLGWRHPAGIAITVHGAVLVADTGNNRLERLLPDGRVHPFAPGLLLQRPTGLAVDRAGNVYLAERIAGDVRKISPQGKLLATWGKPGSGTRDFSFRSQRDMNGIAVDSKGLIYVADTGNNRVKVLSPAGKVLAIWK